jgi:hypothetical protein
LRTTFKSVSDFLKGLFMGVLIGLTERPDKSITALAAALKKRREQSANDALTRSETGIVSPRK